MHNFGRALRLALRYRLLFLYSIFCALMVAVTWGGNIGAIYPVFEVAFQGKSIPQWVDEEAAAAQREIQSLDPQIIQLKTSLTAAGPEARPGLAAALSAAEARRAAEQAARANYQWLAPYAHRYLPQSAFPTLVWIIVALLVGTLIKSIFFVWHAYVSSQLANLAVFDLRKKFYRHTLRMHLASFGESGTSELMSRFTYDIESLVSGMRNLFGKAVREPLKMIACLIGAGFVCWRLLLLTLLVAPLCAWTVSRLAKILKRANRRAMENMSQVYSLLEETFQGIKVVKAFTMERYERRRFHQNSKSFLRHAMKIARYDALTRPLTEMLGIITICLALLAGAYLVLEGETHLFGIRICDRPLSRSALLLFYGFLAGISDPARKLSEVFNSLQRAAAASDRIYALLDRVPAIQDPPHALPLVRHHREIVFDNVSFHYVPDTPVLEGISLRIPYGETIAVVGPNGCGKSTLVNLLPRFFDPVTGSVRIDGRDLREVRLRELRQQIGVVTQETLLFDDTVFNNIRYGAPRASREDVLRAARQAHAHRFIEERLDSGYETIVGERGSSLSGGQRQRIALARAILRDPAILILDEATSQIDLESEQLIQQTLEQFLGQRTTFLITHRLAAIALADRVLVMDAGRVLDFGRHDELLRRCPLYARLHTFGFRDAA